MELRTTGMEFASEMVIKAHLKGMRIEEVPTTLSPDGRSRPPHLRPWRDGWRHLRFMLLFSPRWIFLYPGLGLFLLGSIVSVVLVSRPIEFAGLGLDIHTLLVAAFLCVLGYQLIIFALLGRMFAIAEGFLPSRPVLEGLAKLATLEVGLILGAVSSMVGFAVLVAALLAWRATGFSALDPTVTMRALIPAVVLMVLGAQTIFASFFLSILMLGRTTGS
jgi:hypothetical protein